MKKKLILLALGSTSILGAQFYDDEYVDGDYLYDYNTRVDIIENNNNYQTRPVHNYNAQNDQYTRGQNQANNQRQLNPQNLHGDEKIFYEINAILENYHSVKVFVHNGIVDLYGYVNNAEDKKKITAEIKQVNGVQQVYNHIQYKYQQTDDKKKTEVNIKGTTGTISTPTNFEDTKIRQEEKSTININDASTLNQTSPSATKGSFVAATISTTGNTEINTNQRAAQTYNKPGINPHKGNTEGEKRVWSTLYELDDGNETFDNITVNESDNRVIVLGGYIDTNQNRDYIVQALRQKNPDLNFKNAIQVRAKENARSGPFESQNYSRSAYTNSEIAYSQPIIGRTISPSKQNSEDQILSDRVKNQLENNNNYYSNLIVYSKNGVVYLSGKVNNNTELRNVLDTVKNIEGVKSVRSYLKTKISAE